MSNGCRITSIIFRNFKALKHFSIALQHMNILVGPNNAGKSTVISALRILAVSLRSIQSRAPKPITIGSMRYRGYAISADTLPVSLENVHTDLADSESQIIFRLSNGNSLYLHFPEDGGCFMYGETDGRSIATSAQFKAAFPIKVGIVPILGPVEHREDLVQSSTVQRNFPTHRASRNFRSHWYHFPERFDEFAAMVGETWPGMTIEKPELEAGSPPKVIMFCGEDRMTREIFWAGSGFQIWCQVLTHLVQSGECDILVIDEPEIYLHPHLQRTLMSLLKDLSPDVLVATHSTEIVASAEPSEVLIIDKKNRSARRLSVPTDTQHALEVLGSSHNMLISQLAQTKRILFVEGRSDFTLLARFARQLGLKELALGEGLTIIPVGGFSLWEKVKATAAGFSELLGIRLRVGAIFDRDYRSDEEMSGIREQLQANLAFAHIHQRKEIENYLLVPSVLQSIVDRECRASNTKPSVDISKILWDITQDLRTDMLSKWLSSKRKSAQERSLDETTVMQRKITDFEDQWASLERRLEIVPGKEVLRRLRTTIKDELRLTLSDQRIVSAFPKTLIPRDLEEALQSLERFRLSLPS